MTLSTSFVLASRSPRRRELLGLVVPTDRIIVIPPRDAAEDGFDDLNELPAIENRLAKIARKKIDDVVLQLSERETAATGAESRVIIAADTAVIVTDRNGGVYVLGQPPEDDSWKSTVRRWFREFYAGRMHLAVTALCVRAPEGLLAERIVRTEVTCVADVEKHLEWYIGTEEPRGKAGGCGIQEAGSIFISKVAGSHSNVVGLPLEALLDVLEELRIEIGG